MQKQIGIFQGKGYPKPLGYLVYNRTNQISNISPTIDDKILEAVKESQYDYLKNSCFIEQNDLDNLVKITQFDALIPFEFRVTPKESKDLEWLKDNNPFDYNPNPFYGSIFIVKRQNPSLNLDKVLQETNVFPLVFNIKCAFKDNTDLVDVIYSLKFHK